MKFTLDIDINNFKAIALLNYIRTLDFVSIDENRNMLSYEQKAAIDEGLNQLKEGNSFTNEEIALETKKRYPNLYK